MALWDVRVLDFGFGSRLGHHVDWGSTDMQIGKEGDHLHLRLRQLNILGFDLPNSLGGRILFGNSHL